MKKYSEAHPKSQELAIKGLAVSEPLAQYGIQDYSLSSHISIINEARKGIKTNMFWDFLKVIRSSKAEFEELLPSSLKTFSRKKTLDEATGERILNIMRVFQVGEELFGDIENFKLWLRKYHPVLGDEPRSFLNTTTGCKVVIDELRRAQHGIMA